MSFLLVLTTGLVLIDNYLKLFVISRPRFHDAIKNLFFQFTGHFLELVIDAAIQVVTTVFQTNAHLADLALDRSDSNSLLLLTALHFLNTCLQTIPFIGKSSDLRLLLHRSSQVSHIHLSLFTISSELIYYCHLIPNVQGGLHSLTLQIQEHFLEYRS